MVFQWHHWKTSFWKLYLWECRTINSNTCRICANVSFTMGLFSNLASARQPTLNLLSKAGVTSRQVSKCKHRLQLAEMEAGLEGIERTHGCLSITPLERQGAHRSYTVLKLHCRWRGGKWNFDCYNNSGWELTASQNCVLLRNKRTSPFRQSNFVWHFLCTEYSVFDFYYLYENVFPTEQKKDVILRDHKNGGQFVHKQMEKGQCSQRTQSYPWENKRTLQPWWKAHFQWIKPSVFWKEIQRERHGNHNHCG